MKTTKILLLIVLLAVCYSCESNYLVLGKYDLEGVCDIDEPYKDKRIVTIKQGKKDLRIDIGGGLVFKAYETNDSSFTIPPQSFKSSNGQSAGFSGEGIIRNDSLFLHYHTSGSFGKLECDCKGKKIE